MPKLYIHAVNIHNGGGRNLLSALLAACPSDLTVSVALDRRMILAGNTRNQLNVRYFHPTIWGRLTAELSIKQQGRAHDKLLFFGNLPPNRYLIDAVGLYGFPFKTKLRLWAERLWLSLGTRNVDEFIVQTPTMKRLLELRTQGRIPVRVLPFMENHGGYARKVAPSEIQKNVDFLYVASGEPHKNHRQLIEAWCLLAHEGVFPSLKLTVDEVHFGALWSWMAKKIEQCHLSVENVGSVPPDQIKLFYDQAGALIYPSTFESFGLPLIEARQAGLPVLASELDYVRDVLDPEQSFDPHSAVSIARAVKRFLGIEEQPLPLQDAGGFITHIFESAK
jgi:glycosyltransferase involved in cell wall biosynthesis